MDIANLSRVMSDMSVRSAIDVSLMKMSMDCGSGDLNTVNKMLDDTAQDPNLGNIIDVKV